jgi:hypothetical protein
VTHTHIIIIIIINASFKIFHNKTSIMSGSSSSSSILPQDVAVGNHIRSVSSSSSNNNNNNNSNNKNPLHHEGDEFAFFSNSTSTTSTLQPLQPPPMIGNNNNNNATTFSGPVNNMQGQPPPPPPMDTMSMALTIALPLLLVVAFILCSRSNVPGEQYWRGAQIRETARRIRQARIVKKQRHDMTPEERLQQILTNMRAMTIVGKDNHTGYLKLSHDRKVLDEAAKAEQQQQQQNLKQETTIKTNLTDDTEESPADDGSSSDDDDDDMTTKANNIFRRESERNDKVEEEDKNRPAAEDKSDTMLIQSKGSEDTADTQDLEEEVEDDGSPAVTEEEDDDVCHICLDSFEVGDVVMWSRHRKSRCCSSSNTNSDAKSCLGCRHVFHQECLMPWLMEKRENECPSCRAPFIADAPIPEENESTVLDDPLERVEVDQDGTIQVTMGDGTRTTINDNSTDEDIEALVRQLCSHVKETVIKDDADGTDDVDDDSGNDIQEGYSFVIARGLIKTIPNNYGSWAGPVPFRTMLNPEEDSYSL